MTPRRVQLSRRKGAKLPPGPIERGKPAWLCTSGLCVFWWRCVVLSTGPKRSRVRFTAKTALPGRRGWVPSGTVATVPTESLIAKPPKSIRRSGQGLLVLTDARTNRKVGVAV